MKIFKKPIQDKIILVDIILGVAVIGQMLGIAYVPAWVTALLVALAVFLELSSRAIRMTQIDRLMDGVKKLMGEIDEKQSSDS